MHSGASDDEIADAAGGASVGLVRAERVALVRTMLAADVAERVAIIAEIIHWEGSLTDLLRESLRMVHEAARHDPQQLAEVLREWKLIEDHERGG